MANYSFTWIVECVPSARTQDDDHVHVPADHCRCDHGALVFTANHSDGEYVLAIFAPGQWLKAEVCEAMMGSPNGMFATNR